MNGFKFISLGCKNQNLKHVVSLRRQGFMYLKNPEQTLNVSFYVKHGESLYSVYATSDSLRCFECGVIGHKRFTCLQKNKDSAISGSGNSTSQASEGGQENDDSIMENSNVSGEGVGEEEMSLGVS